MNGRFHIILETGFRYLVMENVKNSPGKDHGKSWNFISNYRNFCYKKCMETVLENSFEYPTHARMLR